MIKKWLGAAVLGLMLVIAGCGGEPKADVTLFMMGSNGIPSEVADKLETSLRSKVGETPTIDLMSSPVFSPEKMVVEIAAGGHGVLVFPKEQLEAMKSQGAFVPLDDVAKAEDFPDGVFEIEENGVKEKHLYVIPLENTKWFKELNLVGKDLFAFIPPNAPDAPNNFDLSKQVMKRIAEKAE